MKKHFQEFNSKKDEKITYEHEGRLKKETELSQGLSKILADTFILYLKTQSFHWKVKGPNFGLLHKVFEEQYRQMAEAIDEIAERIRTLGFNAPGSFSEFSKLTSIQENSEGPLHSKEMLKQLLENHETLSRSCREIIQLAQGAKDSPTADLLSKRQAWHEKVAWILRVSQED